MTNVSTPVLNAPPLPSAPMYRGSTFEERRTFMRQYETYTMALAAYQTPSNRPFVVPVVACIEGNTRRRIAMFEFGCAPEAISNEQWIDYFLEANVPVGGDNYLAIDEAIKSLHMSTALKEAQSRMNKLQSDMYKCFEAHNLGNEMFAKAPRRIVRYLLEALQPAGFRDIVRHQLTMESNKEMKKQTVSFCKWVTTMLAQYMQWNEEARGQKPASETKAGGRTPKGKPSPTRPASTTPATTSLSPVAVFVIAPPRNRENADRLITQARERRKASLVHSRKVIVRPSAASTDIAPSQASTGHVFAVIEGVEVQANLLDSGSDESLVSRSALETLVKQHPELEVTEVSLPIYAEAVSKQLIALKRNILLPKVTLVTSAGPLVLRNLGFGVDENDTDLNITVVMERLGYSADSLLVAALNRQPEYDGGGRAVGYAASRAECSPLSRIQRL
ncbi:hypothetical protein GN244_ATG11930 [Phytophthora infestans]|uniref:Peptidase A2 domain-containing protein n=1 Tax=Phytophthora infestans TaxID=4787 RepID=A0A833WBF1_PHYIN|nr:hypothetical protein GN244_ATG11930 [Phytophthora infestans]